MKKVTKKLLSIILVVATCISNFLISSATGTKKVQIPEDAVEFNGHYYKLFDLSLTWQEAKEHCENLGGHLATVISQEEQSILNDIASKSSKNNLWLGAHIISNNKFEWVTGESFEYTNWDYKEPNNAGHDEYYLMMYIANGKWNDEDNSGKSGTYTQSDFGFICEWEDVASEKYPDGYKFTRDKYHFQNFEEKIDDDIYIKAYGSVKGSFLYTIHELKKHGHCYGMSSTTATLLKYHSAINSFKLKSTGSYASTLSNIDEYDISELFKIDARTYIKYGYIYQFDSNVKKTENNSQDNVCELYNAVLRYVNGTGNPVIINIYHEGLLGRKDGHSLFAVGILEEKGKQYILINDSNNIVDTNPQKMEINLEKSTWEYNVEGWDNYSSENGFFTYSFPADMVYKIGLLLNSNHSEFLSTNNNLVTSTSDISANCDLQEIYSTSGTNETDSTTKLYWAEEYADEIEITATEDNSTISVSDNNSSVSVEIDSSDSANFFVDDDSNNSVVLNCTDEENVDISFKTANCSGDEVEIVVSATANDDNVTASLTDNGISISGVSDGDISVIKYDEIVETKTITETEIELETELPNAGHDFVDGVCTDCGERTIQIDEMTSQIRFTRNDVGSYAEKFDVRTRAMISDEDFTELVGATNEEAANNIDKIGFVYTVEGENFSANSAQAVAQGEKVAGYIDKPVKYIQDADGYYMFTCLVTDIPETDKNYMLTAYAYICVNGKWYFSEEPINADFNSLHSTYYPIACEKYGWNV